MKLKLIISPVILVALTMAHVSAAPDKPKVVTEVAVRLGGEGPEGVAYDAKSDLFYFVAESIIYKVDRKGKIKKRIEREDRTRYRGITRTAKGQFLALAASASEIHVFDSKGGFAKKIKLPMSPNYRAISCSVDGRTIYVSDRSKIVVFDVNGKKTKEIAIPNGDIQGIAATSDGSLWVVDDETLIVTLLDKKGKKVRGISLKGLAKHTDPEGLALDAKSEILYVSFDRSSSLVGVDISASE